MHVLHILNKSAWAVWKLLGMLIIAIIIAIVMRSIVFAPFTVPSKSMLPVLRPGDFIVGTKLIPGPRFSLEFHGDGLKFSRLPGLTTIRRNDVLIFNPYVVESGKMVIKTNSIFVKRCLAKGGDTISIKNGFYLVNRTPTGNNISQTRLSDLTKSEVISSGVFFGAFPWHSSFYNWNIKDFGPLYVPKSGDVIALNAKTLPLYEQIIELESGKKPLLVGQHVRLGSRKIDRYTFRYNYYFMSGDNVEDSNDSRYWGLLPEPMIIGKAIMIVASKNSSGKYIFNDLFKAIK